MRRLEPQAALTLPSISPVKVSLDANCWTVTERCPSAGISAARRRARRRRSESPPRLSARKAKHANLDGPATARGHSTEVLNLLSGTQPEIVLDLSPPSGVGADSGAETDGGSPDKGSKNNSLKARAIENWLNHTLSQTNNKPNAAMQGTAVSTAAKQMQGLSQFGVDAAALEKLGLDPTSAERVYRAMFVYSQGLHAVFQEAVGRAKSSSQALLVLWRAFTAVLEHAGQNEGSGTESLAALVHRGNVEERQRLEGQYREQVASLTGQYQKIVQERRSLQEEFRVLREDEMRLRNESEMYRNEHEVAMTKYESEIKLRVDAEVRLLDTTRWAEALQESLDKEHKSNQLVAQQLKEEISTKEAAMLELESLRTQVKVLEAQAAAYKQGVMEAGQQKQRHEQQVGQLKQQIERMTSKINELKEQLELEADTNKKLLDQHSSQQREMQKLERQCEDDRHVLRELQKEREVQRKKIEKMDTELTDLVDDRRSAQKQFNDLQMDHRTNQIDLKRKTEQLERTEVSLEKVQKAHHELLDTHRVLTVEAENLREDVSHLESQVSKETALRKELQQDKKVMSGQLQTTQIQLDNLQIAMKNTQKELQTTTETKVKLESIVRDKTSAMQKVTLEHQVQTKAHAQKVAMLERVIADERNERRALVGETQSTTTQREEALQRLKRKDLELGDLKRQRLEKEEELNRYKVLLKAQEQRNGDQLVTVDKYRASVVNHEAEMRQMQVLLECEREEAKRQLVELQDAFFATRCTLEQRIEYWRMRYEDALSQLNFSPITEKLQVMEKESAELKEELQETKDYIAEEIEKVKNREQELQKKDERIKELTGQLKDITSQRDDWRSRYATTLQNYEREAVARNDAEQSCERIKMKNKAFDMMKSALEEKITKSHAENMQLKALLNKSVTNSETQASVETSIQFTQTDLSYQYLESTNTLQADRWRRERLYSLKKSSHFVDEPEARRDFQFENRHGNVVDIQFDEKGASRTGCGGLNIANEIPMPAGANPQGKFSKNPAAPPDINSRARKGNAQRDNIVRSAGPPVDRVPYYAEMQTAQRRSGLTPSPWSSS